MSEFSKYDSAFCGNIPIHIINTIQEYGVLLVLEKNSLQLAQVSENAGLLFDTEYKTMVGQPVSRYMGKTAMLALQQYSSLPEGETVSFYLQVKEQRHHALVHGKNNMLLLEIELAPASEEESFAVLYHRVRPSIARIEAAADLPTVCRVAAAEIKKISGFDKVMIYAFDKDWNGNVLAEAMEPGMESYLGFTFPASDIPKPARDMYLKNPYRYIPDREFRPVKLYPVVNPLTNTFLDMSACNLRAVAAVHVEYLKNMQVMASMSVRLMKDQHLWGLVACHHKTARAVSSQLCTLMELFSTVVSARIQVLHHQQYRDLAVRMNNHYAALLENIYQRNNLVQGLLEGTPDIRTLFDAQGAVISYRNKIHTAGDVPDMAQLEDLLLWLHLKQLHRVFCTDSLPALYDSATLFSDTACGLLVIPIQTAQDEYILLFRKELVQTTNWGGNPEERIFFEPQSSTAYHPRHSFQLWQEHVKGFSRPWVEEEIKTAERLRSFIYEFITPYPGKQVLDI
jgi:light-regulated signal transduction histidine kinase (bacteriophytochrome)